MLPADPAFIQPPRGWSGGLAEAFGATQRGPNPASILGMSQNPLKSMGVFPSTPKGFGSVPHEQRGLATAFGKILGDHWLGGTRLVQSPVNAG